MSPIEFDSLFSYRQYVGSRAPHRLQLHQPVPNTVFRTHSFSHRVISVWNNLPKLCVEAETVTKFKENLTQIDLSSYLRCYPTYYA